MTSPGVRILRLKNGIAVAMHMAMWIAMLVGQVDRALARLAGNLQHA
jgi:hypothetical protein